MYDTKVDGKKKERHRQQEEWCSMKATKSLIVAEIWGRREGKTAGEAEKKNSRSIVKKRGSGFQMK